MGDQPTDPEEWIGKIDPAAWAAANAAFSRTLSELGEPEETRLESGQLLRHHMREDCSGFCCLHGTSPFPQCKQRRHYHSEKRFLVHECACGEFHPCPAAVEFSKDHGGPLPPNHVCCGILAHCEVPEVVFKNVMPPPAADELTELEDRVQQLASALRDLVEIAGRQSSALLRHSLRLSKLAAVGNTTADTIDIQNKTTATLTSAVSRLQRRQKRDNLLAAFGAAGTLTLLILSVVSIVDAIW